MLNRLKSFSEIIKPFTRTSSSLFDPMSHVSWIEEMLDRSFSGDPAVFVDLVDNIIEEARVFSEAD